MEWEQSFHGKILIRLSRVKIKFRCEILKVLHKDSIVQTIIKPITNTVHVFLNGILINTFKCCNSLCEATLASMFNFSKVRIFNTF